MNDATTSDMYKGIVWTNGRVQYLNWNGSSRDIWTLLTKWYSILKRQWLHGCFVYLQWIRLLLHFKGKSDILRMCVCVSLSLSLSMPIKCSIALWTAFKTNVERCTQSHILAYLFIKLVQYYVIMFYISILFSIRQGGVLCFNQCYFLSIQMILLVIWEILAIDTRICMQKPRIYVATLKKLCVSLLVSNIHVNLARSACMLTGLYILLALIFLLFFVFFLF